MTVKHYLEKKRAQHQLDLASWLFAQLTFIISLATYNEVSVKNYRLASFKKGCL